MPTAEHIMIQKVLEILSVVTRAFLTPSHGVYIQASESISGNRINVKLEILISCAGLRDFEGESLNLTLPF
jgi:hypothetical protein